MASLGLAQDKDYIFNIAQHYHNGEQIVYAVEEKDKYSGTFTYRITNKNDILTIQGSSDYSNDYLLEARFQYDLKTNFPISSYYKNGRSGDYKEIFTEFKKDTILITAKDGEGERKRTLTKEGVVYDAESSGFLLNDYPFSSKEIIYFKLLVDYEKVYTLAAQNIGEEKIVVPMGEIDCYKVKYKATGSILINLFAPTLNIWFSKKNLRMVKFIDEDITFSLKEYKE
jgi:hypothetical protein